MGGLIVLGVDGSPASYTALRWALAHAGRADARVHAARCWTPVVARRWEAAAPPSRCRQKPDIDSCDRGGTRMATTDMSTSRTARLATQGGLRAPSPLRALSRTDR
jgi:nucleotide-binding universal stress UspA family protein